MKKTTTIFIKKMEIYADKKERIKKYNSEILKVIDVTDWSMRKFNQFMNKILK